MENRTYIHHSHISGEIIGYAHSYCNSKVRKNQTKINVVAHNLFRFDFFFFLKGLRAGVWKIRNITIGGKNPTNEQGHFYWYNKIFSARPRKVSK